MELQFKESVLNVVGDIDIDMDMDIDMDTDKI